MNCKLSSEYIMKYFDKDVNDIETAHMKQHFKTCKKCSMEFEELSSIFGALENDSIIEPPQDFELNVMEKVNTVELVRKKRNDRFLIALYSLVSAFILLVAMTFNSLFGGLSVFAVIGRLGENFSLLSSSLLILYELIVRIYSIFSEVIGALLQVSVLLIKTYYYVLALLLGMLLIVQRMFMTLVRQNNGGMG